MSQRIETENEWSSWVGRSTELIAFLDPAQAVRMQATLDRSPSLVAGDEVPPAWHWLFFHDHFPTSDLGPDGHTRLGILMPQFPLPRRMWAGGVIEWHQPLLLGQEAKRRTTIQSITSKDGRTGPLIFTTLVHEVWQNNQLCITEEQHIVYRAAAKVSTATTPETAESQSEFQASWQFGTTELFRYSALTFNGHKIHYDADYTRDVEGYPGLVVHGPLLATLMLDLATSNSRSLRRFTYRAMSPVTLPHGLTVHGTQDGANTQLWVAHQNGALAMSGQLEGQ